jgi:predicted ATPase
MPLISHCSPYHQDSALHPVISQLLRAANIERDDSSEAKLDKLEALLTQSSGNLVEDMSLFAALLSIPGGNRYPLPNLIPQRLKKRTLGALIAHLKRLAAREPVLMVFEDLHWVDPTSLELLSQIVDQVSSQRVVLLATARPEFTPPWPSHRHISTVSLSRLGRPEVKSLVAGVTRGKALPPEVLDQIVTRTDGIPLFIEELTKTMLESGLLRERKDDYVIDGPFPALSIPMTLHASLMARLDRLAPVREVVQIAAALGLQFSHELLLAVAGMPERQLSDAMEQLIRAELIFRRGTPPDEDYTFKHTLASAGRCLCQFATGQPPATARSHRPHLRDPLSRGAARPTRTARPPPNRSRADRCCDRLLATRRGAGDGALGKCRSRSPLFCSLGPSSFARGQA